MIASDHLGAVSVFMGKGGRVYVIHIFFDHKM